MVKSIMRSSAKTSVVDAVQDGLYCLDGRAVAALLKELSKNGLQQAAAELFDWLRQLPGSHQLSRLVDVYTYTTIISQCGNHQQLRKALELVAEMRSKGIACNIHTFSALMSVCVKCNECELALDVYQQLLQEGCTPNMVTYNILIDIHSKSGQCDQAVKVLDEIRNQGLVLEARTYNTVITSCSKTGQPDQALHVYRRMLGDGVAPTGTTYTSLVSAYGKTGQVEEALQVYEEMKLRGCECNVITYSSLVSACEKAGRWEVALQLLDCMLKEDCRPNVVTYNGLIGACGQGGAPDKATGVFEHMVSSGCRPDAVTFSVLIAAYERGGMWGKALQTLEKMQQHGFRPDACVYNCVLESLWKTGLAAAQEKAAQLFQFACRQGHLRLHNNSNRESTAVAHTYSTALLVLLKWLSDCRDHSATMQRSAASQPSASLRLQRGKHSRPDQRYPPVQAALQQLALAFQAPLSIQAEEQAILVKADQLQLAAWLGSDRAALMLEPVCHPLSMPVPSAALIHSDHLVGKQCGTAFAAVQEFETSHTQHLVALGPQPATIWRDTVDFLVKLAGSFHLPEDTTHDTLQLFYRVLTSGASVGEGEATTLAAALLTLTCKQGVVRAAVPDGALVFGLLGLPHQALPVAEQRLLSALGGDLVAVSALRVLHLYLERIGCHQEVVTRSQRHKLMVMQSTRLVTKAALTPVFYQFQPSVVAAACLCKGHQLVGFSPDWPAVLQTMTRYSLDAPNSSGFKDCMELIDVLGLAN